jgi:hypothetical protein
MVGVRGSDEMQKSVTYFFLLNLFNFVIMPYLISSEQIYLDISFIRMSSFIRDNDRKFEISFHPFLCVEVDGYVSAQRIDKERRTVDILQAFRCDGCLNLFG